jgi:hypothetical protein
MSRLTETVLGTRPTPDAPPAPCGHPANPHVVDGPRALLCENCGARLAPVLLERLRVALAAKRRPRDT